MSDIRDELYMEQMLEVLHLVEKRKEALNKYKNSISSTLRSGSNTIIKTSDYRITKKEEISEVSKLNKEIMEMLDNSIEVYILFQLLYNCIEEEKYNLCVDLRTQILEYYRNK